MSGLQEAWDGVGIALATIARDHAEFEDIVRADTTANAHRIDELVELCAAAESAGCLRLGRTLTLTRRLTGSSLCIAIALSDLPVTPDSPELLTWQFGFWLDEVPGRCATSPLHALTPVNASLLVLEKLRESLEPVLGQFIADARMTQQAFVSYVREDSAAVDGLCQALNDRGVATWTDRTDLEPGVFWKDEIRKAIRSGGAFIACFSRAYEAKSKTYMNEELTVAIEELRMRPRDRAWFFPVLLDDSEVPDVPIGAGATLRDLQSVSLVEQGDEAVKRLARALRETARDDGVTFDASPGVEPAS